MADFCYQCTTELFNVDGTKNDFYGLATSEQVKEGYLPAVLCEGCGFIMVDQEGKRVKSLDEQ